MILVQPWSDQGITKNHTQREFWLWLRRYMELMMTATQLDPTPKLKRNTKQKSIYLHVVDQIQQSIKTGHLLPGDQLLPERELAEQFGVSRPSVRQALAVLDNQGVIEITPRDGAYIRRPDLEHAVVKVSSWYILPYSCYEHLRRWARAHYLESH